MWYEFKGVSHSWGSLQNTSWSKKKKHKRKEGSLSLIFLFTYITLINLLIWGENKYIKYGDNAWLIWWQDESVGKGACRTIVPCLQQALIMFWQYNCTSGIEMLGSHTSMTYTSLLTVYKRNKHIIIFKQLRGDLILCWYQPMYRLIFKKFSWSLDLL